MIKSRKDLLSELLTIIKNTQTKTFNEFRILDFEL